MSKSKQPIQNALMDNLERLSPEDAACTRRWLAEVGAERLADIVATLGTPKRGRVPLTDARLPLVREMARIIYTAGCTPHKAAAQVANSQIASRLPLNARQSVGAITKWLLRYWGQNGQKLLSEYAGNLQRQAFKPRSVDWSASAEAMMAFDNVAMVLKTPKGSIDQFLPEFAISRDVLKYLFPASNLSQDALRALGVLPFLPKRYWTE